MGKVMNGGAALSQCSKGIVDADRSPYLQVVRVLLDTLKFCHAGQVNHAQASKRARLWEFCHDASAPAHPGAQFEFLDFAGRGFG